MDWLVDRPCREAFCVVEILTLVLAVLLKFLSCASVTYSEILLKIIYVHG